MTTAERIDVKHSIAEEIRAQVDRAAELVVHDSLFSRLVVEHLGVAQRQPDGSFAGINRYSVYYCPLTSWNEAKATQPIGEWVYGEWSDRPVQKPLESGGFLNGTRIILALGRARKAGNGTAVDLSQLAVGLVEESHGKYAGIHFVGAVFMSNLRTVERQCPEDQFYSAVTGFIATRGRRAALSIADLPNRGGRS